MTTSGPHSFKPGRLKRVLWSLHFLFLIALGVYLFRVRDVPLTDNLVMLALGVGIFALLIGPTFRSASPELAGLRTELAEARHSHDRVRKDLQEKELALREIHHRVKNNMQIISSLISLQSGYFQDAAFQDSLKKSQDRVKSMALVHEKLYSSDEIRDIDLDEYVRDLVSYLLSSCEVDRNRIRLDIAVDRITLNLKTAVPCGLILNELLTNALKHAFADDRKGTITIHCRKQPEGEIRLSFHDDGIGLPENIDVRNTTTMGLQLVSMLVEQLEGKLEIDREEGSTFRIAFRELPETAD